MKINSDFVKKLLTQILKYLDIDAQLEITSDDKEKLILVDIQAGEKTGLLIGNRGKTLNSLQSIVNVIVRAKSEEAYRIIINIADWREKEEERMRGLALQVAERAISSKEPQTLYNLTPAQRREVHMVLMDNPDVKTESFGEGKDRYLIVTPK